MRTKPDTKPQNLDDRRDFLKKTGLAASALATPYFITSSSAKAQEQSKNDRMPIGLIGAGGMGKGNMGVATRTADLVAIADVDSRHAEEVNQKFSKGKADVYEDYRAIIDRDDIKILHIATPDHWHTKPLIEAMLAGKDVYCEKPLTLTIDEGKLIRKVQKETGRIVQVGTQQRSQFRTFVKALAMVAEGRVGKIKRVQAAIGGAPTCDAIAASEPPKSLNWDRWLGPAPVAEYRSAQQGKSRATNCHRQFRWWYEYSGGKLTDWGAHHVDICVMAIQAAGQAANPLSISGSASHPVEFNAGMPSEKDRYNTANEFKFTVKFPEDVEMVIRHDTDNGILIEGTEGRIFVNRGSLKGSPVEALTENPLPDGAIDRAYKNLPRKGQERSAHWSNFFHCAETRKEPISDVHSHMKMLNICHLAGICGRLGRELKWDDEKEEIVGDVEANSFLKRPYRKGYEIEMMQNA